MQNGTHAYAGGQIHATVMTAVAMQVNNGTIVTVMTNLYNAQEHLLIYVNSTLLNFSFAGNYYQQFPGESSHPALLLSSVGWS